MTSLYRRLVWGAALAVGGSWLLAALRMNLVHEALALTQHETIYFILDILALVMAIFGFLTTVTVLPELRARLQRLENLGEKNW